MPGIADSADRKLSGILRAITSHVQGNGAGAAAGIRAMFAMRITGAQRSGLPADQIAAAVMGLQQEMDGALTALAKNQELEMSGRIAAAILQHGSAPDRTGGSADNSERAEPTIKRPTTTPAEKVRSFKAAARATLSPAPAAPQAGRRRRGGGAGGVVGFHRAGRRLVFRPARLPVDAYNPAIAFLADTLHWLELWQEPETYIEQNNAQINFQNLLSPSL